MTPALSVPGANVAMTMAIPTLKDVQWLADHPMRGHGRELPRGYIGVVRREGRSGGWT